MKTSSNQPGTTLITGSSSGIGYHLAREFARHGHPLVLIAPVSDELQDIAADLQQEFRVDVRTLGADLTHTDVTTEISTALAQSGIKIDCLVNNAGFGERGRFWEIPPEKHISMIRLNTEAVVRLIHPFLPGMVASTRVPRL